MVFRPDSWSEPYRFVIKRTPIIDKDDKQLYLDDGMRKYAYWIVVTNSTRSNTAVLRIAQGRGNQENLIKDFKHGLGLSHVPTGFLAANRAYFLIAALAWNLKTWMLNLLQLGDGAVLRFKRFLYRGYAKRGWWQRLGVACCSNCLRVSTIRGSVKRSPGSLRSRSRRLLLSVSWHGEVRPETATESRFYRRMLT